MTVTPENVEPPRLVVHMPRQHGRSAVAATYERPENVETSKDRWHDNGDGTWLVTGSFSVTPENVESPTGGTP